ncbi:MAG TPA: sensor histidine kinase [Gemmatimonadaceae bacterium]
MAEREDHEGEARPRARTTAWPTVAVVVLAWSVPALLNTTMELLVAHRSGYSVDVLAVLAATATPWCIWAAVTPLIRRVVRARPLSWWPSPAALGSHIGLWAAATVLFVVVNRALRAALGLPVSSGGTLASVMGWAPFTILAYGAAAGIAHAGLFARRARDEAIERAVLAEQLARAQLDALRMQLQPHFLFNALNTISMLVREQDAATAVRLIAELGDILREMLREHRTPEIPLAQEVDLLRRYLAVEEIRFGERLRVDWSIDPRLGAAPVPPFLMQPIVENAIRHGVAKRTDPGVIRIGAESRGDALVLTVVDDGPLGPPNGALSPLNGRDRAGLGLATTRARLEHLYGSRAYVRLTRTEGRFTLVTLVLPLGRPEKDDVAAEGSRAIPPRRPVPSPRASVSGGER